MRSSQGMTAVEAIIAFAVVLVLAALLFPAMSTCCADPAPKTQAKNDVVQLATACIAFESEYGYLPGQGKQAVGGDLLLALVGSNHAINPGRIVFIETSPFKKNQGGLSNGTFLDPWGGPYQVALAVGTNDFVQAGTNRLEVKKRVAVWNDPALGSDPDSAWWDWGPKVKRERRGVASWE